MPVPTIRLVVSYENATAEQLLSQQDNSIKGLTRSLERSPERTHALHYTGGIGGHGGIGSPRVCAYVLGERLPSRLYRAWYYVFPDELNFLSQLGEGAYLEPRAQKAQASMARLRKLSHGNELVDLTLGFLKVTRPKQYGWLNAGPG